MQVTTIPPASTPEATWRPKRRASWRPAPPLPVCIVTGFLGAGKTTFLNHILNARLDLRVGVLVNDFGSVDIDSRLIERVEGGTVSLSNGCICCSIREDFLKALVELVKRPQPPEYVVVETSGVSDPSAVVATLADPSLRHALRVDTILAMVDASEFLTLDGNRRLLAEAQVGVADLVAINKVDLVTSEAVALVRAEIAAIAEDARVVEVNRGEVPLELVIADGLELAPRNQHAKGARHRAAPTNRVARPPGEHGQGPCCHAHKHDGADHLCTCLREDHEHDKLKSAFESFCYETDKVLSLQALRDLLRHLPREIYRLKGIFHVKEDPENALLLQVVGNRINEAVLEAWGGTPRTTTVVAIGDVGRIDADALAAAFEHCAASVQGLAPISIVERAISYLRAAGIIAEAPPQPGTGRES